MPGQCYTVIIMHWSIICCLRNNCCSPPLSVSVVDMCVCVLCLYLSIEPITIKALDSNILCPCDYSLIELCIIFPARFPPLIQLTKHEYQRPGMESVARQLFLEKRWGRHLESCHGGDTE